MEGAQGDRNLSETAKMLNNDEPQPKKEQEEWSKRRILKNLAALSGGVFFYLSAAIPSYELQSSINFKNGIGTNSAAIGSAINFVPALMLTPYFLRKFGLKSCIISAIVIGSVAHYGNFYPRWYTLIPSAIFTYIGILPMWAAKGTYISYMAEKYAKVTGAAEQEINSFFFGIFYSMCYCGYIFGSLLPYYLLKRDYQNSTDGICGYDFCDGPRNDNNTNFLRPPDHQVYLLFGTFSIISLIGAAVIIFFLDALKGVNTKEATWTRAFDSIRLCTRWEQICMCTISGFRGLNRALLVSDFTKAYITCTWGMRNIGYVMIGFGVSCGVLSVSLGYLIRWLGRPVLFAFAVCCNLTIILALIYWEPSPDQHYVFFILVTLWGASNAVWESQIAALNPILFPDQRDASYTNYSSSDHAGGSVGYAISATVCMKYKVFGNFAMLVAAVMCYTALEVGPLRTAKQAVQVSRTPSETSREISQPLLPLASLDDSEWVD